MLYQIRRQNGVSKKKIIERNEWMTAFKTRYGIFEWFVIPFGLANAFNIFQKYINWAFRDFFDEFYSLSDDDIWIYITVSRANIKKIKIKIKTFARNRTAIKCQ